MGHHPQGICSEVWEAGWLVLLFIQSHHHLPPPLFTSSNPVHIPKFLIQLRNSECLQKLLSSSAQRTDFGHLLSSYAPAVSSSFLLWFRVTLWPGHRCVLVCGPNSPMGCSLNHLGQRPTLSGVWRARESSDPCPSPACLDPPNILSRDLQGVVG